MDTNLEQLSIKALEMPVKSRALLAKQLLDSLDSGQEPYQEHELLWAREAERRYQEIQSGTSQTKPADSVMRAARERYKR